jgi:hypothetical protein
MIAHPLTVIPPKYTGLPITQEIGEKIAKLLVNFVRKLCFKVNFKANYARNF